LNAYPSITEESCICIHLQASPHPLSNWGSSSSSAEYGKYLKFSKQLTSMPYIVFESFSLFLISFSLHVLIYLCFSSVKPSKDFFGEYYPESKMLFSISSTCFLKPSSVSAGKVYLWSSLDYSTSTSSTFLSSIL